VVLPECGNCGAGRSVAGQGLQEHGGVRGELRFPPWEVD